MFEIYGTLEAVLFDLDGTLAPTDQLKFGAHRHVITELGGPRLGDEVFLPLLGLSRKDTVQGLLATAGLPGRLLKRYCCLLSKRYEAVARAEAKAHPGATECLRQLRKAGIRIAVVTSSNRRSANIVLQKTKLARYINCLVSSNEVRNRKPHPEPYFKALARLRLRPNQVIVCEDTDPGCTAAHAAGLKIMGIRHELNGQQALTEASMKVPCGFYQEPDRMIFLMRDLAARAPTPT